MTWWWIAEEEESAPYDKWVIAPFPSQSDAQDAVDYANKMSFAANVPYIYYALADEDAKHYRGWYPADGASAATGWEEDVEDDFTPSRGRDLDGLVGVDRAGDDGVGMVGETDG